jgi:uracil phosphoribosyltransferase
MPFSSNISISALGHLPYREKVITTPVGETYNGLEVDGKICGVAMVPSGESMEIGLRTVCKSIRIGKILIQRTAGDEPKELFVKLPPDISERWVLLLDPMLATGKSALKALELITAQGVRPKNILFLNLIASVEGLSLFTQRFPDVKIITTHIDSSVDPVTEMVLPGIGEFSNRYFGTD